MSRQVNTVDYLGQRREVSVEDVAAVGIGDEALPVLLAAAVDSRIRQAGHPRTPSSVGITTSGGVRPRLPTMRRYSLSPRIRLFSTFVTGSRFCWTAPGSAAFIAALAFRCL